MQGQRGSHRRRRDCELRAERLRAPVHILESATLAMTGREATTVLGDGDEEMLLGKTCAHRGHRYPACPYESGGEPVTAVLSGRIIGTSVNPPMAMPHIKAATLNALAVAGFTRLPQMPEVPATAEAGLNGFDIAL